SNPVVPSGILPSPGRVLGAMGQVFVENELIVNLCRSIGLNVCGYLEAIIISIIFGFVVGLLPLFNGLFAKPIDAFRFVPLTGVIGLFIVWFGLGVTMKVHFLAFGILIYMLPVIVTRINEVEDVYLKTAYTLGASKWQIIRTVYIPHVLSKFSDDIRVLTAISWTYIIIIESIGNEGGLGALMWRTGIRQGNIAKLFAMLFIIIIIGFIQDKLFTMMDRKLYPYKYLKESLKTAGELKSQTLFQRVKSNMLPILGLLSAAVMLVLLINEFVGILGKNDILSYAFGATFPVIAILMGVFSVWIIFDFIHQAKSKKLTLKKA
ncbi:MAG: ABC transporter permease subunit, partial [Saprospiraceae bacterium]|nr:ABC transporter permease subunit [Saprospiraceae bacterium]